VEESPVGGGELVGGEDGEVRIAGSHMAE
jgi:hypothetical protein